MTITTSNEADSLLGFISGIIFIDEINRELTELAEMRDDDEFDSDQVD
jgi:hypothetical protein